MLVKWTPFQPEIDMEGLQMSLSSALPHKLQQARAQSSGTSVAYLAYNLRLGNKVSIHYVLVSVRERITD